MIKITPISAYELADFLGVKRPAKDCNIENISFDTREKFQKNTCFIALEGENFSGDSFLNEAIKKGAVCVVSKLKTAGNVSFISVFDTKKVILKLASREIKNTKIIAVTGSVGKTTVKEMIKAVLVQEYKVCSSFENENNEVGVAKTLFSISNDDFCIVEMGMRGLGEIDTLADDCKPFISVITNCGRAHIERLGTKENIFKAKCEILKHTNAFCIVPFEKRFENLNYGKVRPFYIGNGGDIELGRIKKSKNGIIADVIDNLYNDIVRLNIPSIFSHDAVNALIAYLVGRLCGVNIENIKKGILEFKNCQNRGKLLKVGDFEIIDDSYNASFEGSEQAIISLSEYARLIGKIPILIFGDMLEIGEYSSEYHQKIGQIARKNGIVSIICCGEYSDDLCKGFGGGVQLESVEEIEHYILTKAPKGSVFLIKASRKMNFDKIVKDLKERINEA